MSDSKSTTWTERRLRYRRRLQKEKAVSPVVATLILILIAVAAAAALYLWLVGWQGGVTKSIGTPSIPSDLSFSIGGSTTVYPLSQIAIKWFEQNYTNTNISDQQGGSVAGAEAYCAGQVDVGAASSSFTTAQLAGDGCSSALQDATVQTVIGVDAIVGIISSTNPGFTTTPGVAGHLGQVPVSTSNFTLSFNATTMYAIYAAASSTVPSTNTGLFPGNGSSTGPYAFPSWVCGSTTPAGWTTEAAADHLLTIGWKSCPTLGAATSLRWSSIPFPAGCNAAYWGGSTAGGCFWAQSDSNNTINTYDRLDSSGTVQGFTQKYLQIPKDASSNSCGTDNQLVSCSITSTHREVGNPLLATSVAADKYGLGFNSYGIASSTPNLLLAGYSNDIGTVGGVANSLEGLSTQSAVVFPSVETVLVLGYRDSSAAGAYVPWRVLEYLTDGTPAPGSVEANYINFVLGPAVNLNLCTETGYISLYAA